jgi:hypothetical protein
MIEKPMIANYERRLASMQAALEAMSRQLVEAREALREILDAQDAVNAEAERAEQPGANAWSSAPMVRLISAYDDGRKALEGSAK